MELSERGKLFIKRQESPGGIPDLEAYADSAGYVTIGYGHLLKPEEQGVLTITAEKAEEWFKQDIAIAEKAVNKACQQVVLMQNEYDALVSFVYNVGAGAFERSTLLRELKALRPTQAGNEFKRWNRAGGRVDNILVNRRNAERRMFLFGEYGNDEQT